MKERTYRKSHFLIITLTLTLFISTSKHIYDSLVTANTWNKRTHPQNSALHTAHGRILKGDIEPETQERYKALKERIIDLLDEDDESFRDRLNALTHDDYFRKQYNVFIREDLSQKLCKKFILDKPSQKHFNILNSNNNLEKNPFLISPNTNHNNQDYSDPFKFCNNLEEFFDELKHHEECNAKPKGEIKRTNNLRRELTNEVEDYIPSKLEDDISEGSIDSYMYRELVKPRKRSIVPTALKKVDKILKAEVKRFLKKKAAGRYADNGRGIIGKFFPYINKFKIFIPILFFLPLIILATPLIIFYAFVFEAAVLSIFSLTGIFPAFIPIVCVVLLGCCAFNLIVHRPRV
ncbi:Plasmodium exported protein, unknown function [Plasmodium knowlesi strain H]|uniref:Pv-fam-d protein n=3 Tax=Plasmodium knowlesi TaxID=5850 RepID=A0A5K1U150_PLAKH|nr:uncharacterized protein PKNH_1325600 [Plasmodium knowlesi strain H]OTN67661.1 Uncharacterized protein PKNOH_S05370100 [Plasmodium knowlesi]CAA9990292.1 Plasmodium exported protein, unknown function [Plasmodium knowlesi strain H]SBO19498.1 Plasmodium exported protein, unknown function [Plasmodium knowlesi strain H]SBO22837.1 Plasmodium exported protein, unknown function [Plasmodium knowlesi strain H]VVS79766.1 Plasmodium exported protein, unknown function [Plasmodium knowlesi strain H]|eukprot:XP_002260694.1 [Plasmodium knowlesi strain H]